MIGNIVVKRIGDRYFIAKGFSKLKTCIYPHDIDEGNENKAFPLMTDKSIAYIRLDNGKEISTGYHSDYIRRYFEM